MNDEPTFSCKKILLVEDDPRDVELTLAALAEHQLANEVAVVHDGAEALDYLFRRGVFHGRTGGHPVAVLMDINMPRVSGLEVLRVVKSDAELKIIPIIMLTSSREEPDLVQCYQLGVNAYVVKPVDFVDFMNAIKGLGLFWVAINEPPPGVRPHLSEPAGPATGEFAA
jgi:CheY-like chemotaxis protein